MLINYIDIYFYIEKNTLETILVKYFYHFTDQINTTTPYFYINTTNRLQQKTILTN